MKPAITPGTSAPVSLAKFTAFAPGDLVQVIYHGAQVALVHIDKVKNYSMMGKDGTEVCKITWVAEGDMRFYAKFAVARTSVLRPITLKKVVV